MNKDGDWQRIGRWYWLCIKLALHTTTICLAFITAYSLEIISFNFKWQRESPPVLASHIGNMSYREVMPYPFGDGKPDLSTVPTTYVTPVVGILSQRSWDFKLKYGDDYISAGYVKYLQSAGAQVIPVMSFWTDDQISQILNQINGIVIPGGGQLAGSEFYDKVKFIYNWAQDYNYKRKDGYFPIWGVCLGFLTILSAAGGENFEFFCDAHNKLDALNLTEYAAQSKLLASIRNTPLYEVIQHQPMAFNNHHHYIPPEAFGSVTRKDSPWAGKPGPLHDKFHLLATNKDSEGRTYAALAEHVSYPYFAVQFHPEKVMFDWPPDYNINRDRDAVEYSQHLVNTFLDYVRQNTNRFTDVSRFYYLSIENFSSVYTLISEGYALQSCYFFNMADFPQFDRIRNIDF